MKIILIIVVVTLIAFLMFFKVLKPKRAIAPSRYKARRLLTENETEFFRRIKIALPEFHVFPQVAMSALIEPTSKGQATIADRNRIDRKVIDFTVFNIELELICLIELDDSTHIKAKDEARDKITGSAGIKTLRWSSKNKPDVNIIRNEVLKAGGVFPKEQNQH